MITIKKAYLDKKRTEQKNNDIILLLCPFT